RPPITTTKPPPIQETILRFDPEPTNDHSELPERCIVHSVAPKLQYLWYIGSRNDIASIASKEASAFHAASPHHADKGSRLHLVLNRLLLGRFLFGGFGVEFLRRIPE